MECVCVIKWTQGTLLRQADLNLNPESTIYFSFICRYKIECVCVFLCSSMIKWTQHSLLRQTDWNLNTESTIY